MLTRKQTIHIYPAKYCMYGHGDDIRIGVGDDMGIGNDDDMCQCPYHPWQVFS